MHIIFSSMGNDSCALIQWAKEKGLQDVHVAYNNTGWHTEEWEERKKKISQWINNIGFKFHEIKSMGMEQLVRSRKGWPLPRKFQFCTTELKILPAQEFLQKIDPDASSICLVGVRREESKERSKWPEWTEESDKHGGRSLWSPLVSLKTADRDALLARAGLEPLPYRSRECFPCINANRSNMRDLPDERVYQIAQLEKDLGYTRNGKPRTMFRPYRHMGATGIEEVVKWAKSKRGKYQPPVVLGDGLGCDSGMCGD